MELQEVDRRDLGLFNPRKRTFIVSCKVTHFVVQLYRVDGSRGEVVEFETVGVFAERNVQLVRKVVKTSYFRVLECEVREVELVCDAADAVCGEAWDVRPRSDGDAGT